MSLSNITKRYPALVANSDVSLLVQPGETHAVLGEHGAGKSTLMKIIHGSVQPDAGGMQFNGTAVRVRNPQKSRVSGISMVFQHFSLFDTLTVAANVWLGRDKNMSLAVDHQLNRRALRYDCSWPLADCEQSLVPTPSGQLRFPKSRHAQRGIGGEHPVKTDQVQARARHQSRQALHEFQRRHADVRAAVVPGAFELQQGRWFVRENPAG